MRRLKYPDWESMSDDEKILAIETELESISQSGTTKCDLLR